MALKEKGWQVLRIWEHEIKADKLNRKLNVILRAYRQDNQTKDAPDNNRMQPIGHKAASG